MKNLVSNLPWRLSPHVPTLIQDADGNSIGGSNGSNAQSKADAAYIIEAVNRYNPDDYKLPTEFGPVNDLTGDPRFNRRYDRVLDITQDTTAQTNGFEPQPADETPRYLIVERTPETAIFFAYQCDTLQESVQAIEDSDTENLSGAHIHDLDTATSYEVLFKRQVYALEELATDEPNRIPFIHAAGK